jgi:hypothetical protein
MRHSHQRASNRVVAGQEISGVPRLARSWAAPFHVSDRLAGLEDPAEDWFQSRGDLRQNGRERRAQMLLYRAPVHGGEGFVDPDEAELPVQEREAHRRGPKHRVEQSQSIFASAGRLLRLAKESRVVDRHSRLPRQSLGKGDSSSVSRAAGSLVPSVIAPITRSRAISGMITADESLSSCSNLRCSGFPGPYWRGASPA